MAEKDPLARLESCHVRIEEQLRTLEKLADHLAARGPDGVAQATAGALARYFEDEDALHHRDEGDDLFPLLRSRAGATRRSEVAAAIDELEREHEVMAGQWRRLRPKLDAIAAARSPAFDEDEIGRFAWLYRRHLERESLLVLPFAREVLAPTERAELAARMDARREAPK